MTLAVVVLFDAVVTVGLLVPLVGDVIIGVVLVLEKLVPLVCDEAPSVVPVVELALDPFVAACVLIDALVTAVPLE